MSKVSNVRPVCAQRKLAPSPMIHIQKKEAIQKKALPSMSNRPPNPVLSPVRFQKSKINKPIQHVKNATATTPEVLKPVLSSLGPDAPHVKLSSVKASPIVSTKYRKKSLPSIENNSVPTKYHHHHHRQQQHHHQQQQQQYEEPPSKSSESPPPVKKLPVVVRRPSRHQSTRPTSKVKIVQDLKKKKKRPVASAHHHKSRPPKLHMEKAAKDHVFKVPTPRDPTPGRHQDGKSFTWNTPRSTGASSTGSVGRSIRDLPDSAIEKMAIEFVNAEAKRREVSRGIKLTESERAMMKRAFVAGMRNPSALSSPTRNTNLGDLQWEFDQSVDNLDTMNMGFCFDEDDALDNVVVEPIDVTKESKWPDFEPEDMESEMSLSLMSMSLEDGSATPRDLTFQDHLNTPSSHRTLSPTAHQLALVSERYRQGQISLEQKEVMKTNIINSSCSS